MSIRIRLIIALLVSLFLLFSSAFVVDQTEFVLVKRLGEIVAVIKSPGVYFKAPIIDDITVFDNRIVTLDWEEPAKFVTSENKYMLVDSFVKWRIVDPVKYYVSIKSGGENAAEDRLSKVVNAGLRGEFGRRTVHDVIAGERSIIMSNLRKVADGEARQMGIEVVDVRLKRVDYSEDISKSVYDRMISERKRIANQLRSEGSAGGEKIRADADKQREVILSEAYSEAQKIKGEGDAKAGEIYNQTYRKNPEFFAFYRSLLAYKNTFKSKQDIMVLDANSPFFHYLRTPATAPARAKK